jgi:hypothetical protein
MGLRDELLLFFFLVFNARENELSAGSWRSF